MAMILAQQTCTHHKSSLIKVVKTMRTNVPLSGNEKIIALNQAGVESLQTSIAPIQDASDSILMDKSTCIEFPKGGIRAMEEQGEQLSCVSIFRSGKSTTTREFTQKWIELINQSEKGKRVIASGDGGLAV